MSRHRNYSEIRSMFTALDPSRHPDLVAIDDSQFVKYVGFKEETMNEIVTDEQGVLIASSAVARLVDSTTKPYVIGILKCNYMNMSNQSI
jgi:hypothetical protein